MTHANLIEIEQIRTLRMRYSHYLDALDLDALAELFTDDGVCEFGPYGVWRGRSEIRASYGAVMGAAAGAEKHPYRSLHVNTNHWVELTAEDTAAGRLTLMDFALSDPETNPLIWLGVYDEAYRKVAGGWRIERSTLQFLWPKRHLTGDFPGEFPPRDPNSNRRHER